MCGAPGEKNSQQRVDGVELGGPSCRSAGVLTSAKLVVPGGNHCMALRERSDITNVTPVSRPHPHYRPDRHWTKKK